MSFAAVICASHSASESGGAAGGALRATLNFAGSSLVEYQVRQAREAGADPVMILVGAVTQPLSKAVDRLLADGIAVTLIRDMVTLVREAPRDRDMLLVADGAIIAQRYYELVAKATGSLLLVTQDSRATAAFERIDAGQRWAGLLRVTPDLLFGTLDMLGDWDLELTLVRAAVQAGAARTLVPQEEVMEGQVALVERQDAADLVSQALLGKGADSAGGEGGAEHYLLSGLARRVAPMLLRTQVPTMQVRIGATAVAAMGVLAALLTWPAFGLLLMLAALILSLSADRLADLARRGDRSDGVALAAPLIVLLGIALLGGEAAMQMDGIYLALLLGVVMLAGRWRRLPPLRPWTLFTPGSAVLLLLATSVVGHLPLGMSLAMLCAIASAGHIILGSAARN